MDRLETMQWLVTVVDAGSLSAAARRLDRPLSTVSRRIAELERHLGVPLLVRAGRRVEPTEAGIGYLAGARRVLGDIRELERVATGEYVEARGELVVTAPVLFGRRHVLPVIVDFLHAHPAVDVQFVQSDRFVDLVNDGVDVALRIGTLADSTIVARRVGEVRRVVCASPAWLARHDRPATPDALAERGCVHFEHPSGGTWTFGDGALQRRVPVRTRLSVVTAEAAVEAAVAGVGPTRLLSYQIADEVRAGTLEIILADHEPARLPVSIVHTRRAPLPLKIRAFLDLARDRLVRTLHDESDAGERPG